MWYTPAHPYGARWLIPTHSVKIDIVGWGKDHGAGTAEVLHYDFWHRLGRAVIAVAIVWAIAIPLMAVPWLVILTLPAALVLSVFLFVIRMRAPEVFAVCQGTCPDCGQSQAFDLPGRYELPIKAECAKCNRELTLTKATDAT